MSKLTDYFDEQVDRLDTLLLQVKGECTDCREPCNRMNGGLGHKTLCVCCSGFYPHRKGKQ